MSASLLPPHHLAALRTIYRTLAETDLVWVVTGSVGLAIKGIPVTPHDLDIQVQDRAGVETFARLFASYLKLPPTWHETKHTRSWLATFQIQNVDVEIMGEVCHRDDEGFWDDPPNLAANRLFIQVAEMLIPTLSLEFEEDAYRRMGRRAKAELIAQYLRLC